MSHAACSFKCATRVRLRISQCENVTNRFSTADTCRGLISQISSRCSQSNMERVLAAAAESASWPRSAARRNAVLVMLVWYVLKPCCAGAIICTRKAKGECGGNGCRIECGAARSRAAPRSSGMASGNFNNALVEFTISHYFQFFKLIDLRSLPLCRLLVLLVSSVVRRMAAAAAAVLRRMACNVFEMCSLFTDRTLATAKSAGNEPRSARSIASQQGHTIKSGFRPNKNAKRALEEGNCCCCCCWPGTLHIAHGETRA